MSQRKSIAISCLACALALAAVGGILIWINVKNGTLVEPVASYTELELRIELPAGEQSINIWQSPEGVYYFFLPSGSENYQISFENLGEGSTLQLDSVLFYSHDSAIDDIKFSNVYEMQLKLSEDSSPLEKAQVVFLKSEGLPSLFIDTASGNMDAIHADKEVKEEATAFLVGMDGTREYAGNIEYITARGNSTFYEVDKKSYLIRFYKEETILDMPGAEKWILLANMIDDTRIKNELIFQFAETYTTVPSIQGRYVDLYLNGDYAGNYYLCEKVEVGENRLDITNLEERTEDVNFKSAYQNAVPYVSEEGKIRAMDGLNNPEDITGGYLVEHIPASQYEIFNNAFMTDSGHCYVIISPNPATVEQVQYICNYFNEMETALTQEDGIHPVTGKHFSEYIDLDSWTSKYLMEEAFHDPDALTSSLFFYKDSDSVDAHIYAGPMWDYDRAMGSYGSVNTILDNAYQVGEFGIYVQEMMQHQEVREQVYDKFCQYIVPYVRNLLRADVYRLRQHIQASVEMDRIRWIKVRGYYSDYGASCDYLVWFLEHKTDYLQEVWLEEKGEEYCTVTFLDYYRNVYAEYTVKKGKCLTIVPSIATYGAIFNGWYSVEDRIAFNSELPVLQDVTYQSEWIEMDLLLLNGVAIAEMDLSEADPDILRNLADQLEHMQSEGADSTMIGGQGED